MNLTLKQIINWASKHPFFSILIFVVAVFSYGNLFYFGFRLSIPIALRPFLDTYFLSSLALEVLVCLALAALTSRLVVLISRLVLSKFPLKISKVLKQFEIFFLGLFDTSDL
ncbi:MAG: hypothetical protein KJP02_04400, partial [Octadecabacter sp.]|nr:hypothetical protein [Octadecabacter sp.]